MTDYRYIITDQALEVHKSKRLSNSDLDKANELLWSIVDTYTMEEYYEGRWNKIPVWPIS